MRQIYKILSVLLILTLIGSVYAAVQSSYTYTGCLAANSTSSIQKGTLYNLRPGTTPITACKIGDYQISLYDKKQVDSLINSLSNQITSLSNRVSNLENNQSQIYIFGNRQVCCKSIGNGWNNWSEITNYTFYLPVDSYVYVESSGNIANFYDYAAINLGIDYNPLGDTTNYRGYGEYPVGSSYVRQSGFQISNVYFLTKGYHTIHLSGWAAASTYVSGISFNVITDQKGNQLQQTIGIAATDTGKSIIDKEGKVSTT